MGYQMVRRSARLAGRYSPGAYKTAWKLGQYAGRGLKKWYNGRSGGGSSSRVSKAKSVGSLTEQKDVTTLYRRKRAPRRLRRGARRQMKRFIYHMDKLQAMKTCVITYSGQINGSPTGLADGQGLSGITMYGYNTNSYASNIDTANGDMPCIS